MRIYYQNDSLCSEKDGNGNKLPFFKRCLHSLSGESDLQPFSMDDINSVLCNKHHSIGCSIKAPFKFVSWQSQSQWYELFKGENVFLPKCIVFSNGDVSYNIVIIGDNYELRVWADSTSGDRTREQWFSHEPIVYSEDLEKLIASFNILLAHIKKEDEFEQKKPLL